MTLRPFPRLAVLLVCATAACSGVAFFAQQKRDGYKDTPQLPGQKWLVHDSDRPYPPEVTPGATPGAAPSDAIVLFDGKDLSHWTQRGGGAPKWKVENGYFEVTPRTGDLVTKETFGDCQLHIEWQESADVKGFGQGRGNSGVYMMGLFEIQVLDSYRAPTYADGQAGALYGQWPPMVNPIRKPGEWQSYDIVFEAPKFEDGKLVEPAYTTLFFNGVIVHNRKKLNGPSAHRSIEQYAPGVTTGSISLQDHGPAQPLRFRNIWVRKLNGYDQPEAK